MKVLLNKDNVVIDVAEEIEKVPTGFFIKEKNIIYFPNGLRLVETKLNPTPRKDKLENGVIKLNPDYKSPEQLKAEYEKRKAEFEERKKKLNEKIIS